jgi:adenylate kinase
LNLLLLGAPGSGKGTQAHRLADALGLIHVASGDLFRHHLEQSTELGRAVKSYMNRGDLVPDDLTIAMVRERITEPDAAGGVLFDGFPRTVDQARALGRLMDELGREITGAIYLEVSDAVLTRRLAGRQICRLCQKPFHMDFNPFRTCPTGRCQGEHLYQRDDDKPETVLARLATFHRQTEPVVEFYRDAGCLATVAGDDELTAVAARMLEATRDLQSRRAALARSG